MWAATADFDGVPTMVRFDGSLEADPQVIELLTDYADMVKVVGVTPVGPWLTADLQDESSAFLVVCEALTHVQVFAGRIPTLPAVSELSDGEIA